MGGGYAKVTSVLGIRIYILQKMVLSEKVGVMVPTPLLCGPWLRILGSLRTLLDVVYLGSQTSVEPKLASHESMMSSLSVQFLRYYIDQLHVNVNLNEFYACQRSYLYKICR